MKYTPECVQTIIKALEANKGRVNATAEADICYDTFMDWYKHRPEFSEAVKKAEKVARGKGKETAVQCIFRAMEDDKWQAAAWWLERNFPDKYASVRDKAIANGDLPELGVQVQIYIPDDGKSGTVQVTNRAAGTKEDD